MKEIKRKAREYYIDYDIHPDDTVRALKEGYTLVNGRWRRGERSSFERNFFKFIDWLFVAQIIAAAVIFAVKGI